MDIKQIQNARLLVVSSCAREMVQNWKLQYMTPKRKGLDALVLISTIVMTTTETIHSYRSGRSYQGLCIIVLIYIQ